MVDGSRPVRSDDRAEMEILRRTGLPRLAIINSKDDDRDYTEDWKSAFLRNFNSVRVFNAHRASYSERLGLLQTLKGIDQDWEPALNLVIDTFTKDWTRRLSEAADLIVDHLDQCIRQKKSKKIFKRVTDSDREELLTDYQKEIVHAEKDLFQSLRKLYRHHLFQENLPSDSILNYEIFCDETAQVLGLTGKQFAIALATLGAGGGVWLDAVFGGITFGVFTATGAAAGAASALIYGKHLARVEVQSPVRIPGRPKKKLGGIKISIGPNKNPQFFYILLDRCLIYFDHLINWTHARRDTLVFTNESENGKRGFVNQWTAEQRKTTDEYFKALHKGSIQKQDQTALAFSERLQEILKRLSSPS